MTKTEKFLKLCNCLQNATAWTKIKVWWRPVVLQTNAKKWENFETLQLAAECQSINKNQSLIKIKPVVPEKYAKKWRKFENIASDCRVLHHTQKSKFDQDVTSSSWEKCQKLRNLWNFTTGCRMPQHEQKSKLDEDQYFFRKMQKSEENLQKTETLQLAVECHSMNKNQSLIKIKPVVPEKNAKNWWKFGNFTVGCRVAQHKQKSKFDQDQTNSCWEICKKVKKIWKLCNWL